MIPTTFHRIWFSEPIPDRFEGYWERLRELHPGWQFRTWADPEELLPWMRNGELFESFTDYPAAYAFRADVARYEILYRFGGVYVDTDVEPLRSFDPLLADGRPFAAWCSDSELDPAVIASPADHPAIALLVEDLAQVLAWRKAGKATSPPGSTGPRYLTPRWRARADVLRLPPSAFFPYHWADREAGHARPPWPTRSFAVHHWNAGWKR